VCVSVFLCVCVCAYVCVCLYVCMFMCVFCVCAMTRARNASFFNKN